jgi:hypothetical protein
VSLDQAAFPALWKITDATNGDLRPEYLIPVMFSESGLNPALQNFGGADFWGINQINGKTLRDAHVDPHDYLTWPASRQLNRFAGPYFIAQDKQYGPIRSATRLYQANMCPATLPDAHSFEDVIARKGGTKYRGEEAACYAGNAGLFDTQHKGYITVGDLANAIENTLKHASVDAAIAAAYVFRGEPRPGVGQGLTPKNPVFGSDFDAHGNYIGGGAGGGGGTMTTASTSSGFPWLPFLAGVGIIGAAGAAWWYLDQHGGPSRLLENPTSRTPGKGHSRVQSLLFRRDDGWTERRAKNWARDHGFKTSKVDLTDEHIRLRQRPPGGRMRTVQFGHGISAVMRFG